MNDKGNPYKQLRLKTRGIRGRPFTVTKLGKELGVSPACISKIERYINTPTLEIIVAYQKYFKVSYESLIAPLFKNYLTLSHRKK